MGHEETMLAERPSACEAGSIDKLSDKLSDICCSQIEPARASQSAQGDQIEPARASQGVQGNQIEPVCASQSTQGNQIQPARATRSSPPSCLPRNPG